jgi:hypothetical protein
MLKPKRSFQSVVEELIHGLEDGTIELQETRAQPERAPTLQRPSVPTTPAANDVSQGSEAKMPGNMSA